MTSSSVKFTFPSFDDIVRVKRADGGVDVMLNGERIDSIEPVTYRPTDEEIQEHLRAMHDLARIISEQWNYKSIGAVEAVREQRCDLAPDVRTTR